ncbi:hypothetical protein Tco_1369917 [Tanacetum coccineum]
MKASPYSATSFIHNWIGVLCKGKAAPFIENIVVSYKNLDVAFSRLPLIVLILCPGAHRDVEGDGTTDMVFHFIQK